MQKILIIEDNEELRRAIVTGLKTNQFETLEAASESEAHDIARTERPDLILRDLNLDWPGGAATVAGPQTESVTAQIPTILMTGEAAEASDEVLRKPFAISDLLAVIKRRLASPGDSKALDQERKEPEANAAARGTSFFKKPRLSRDELNQLVLRLQTLRENERRALAKTFHDDLTQKLTVLAIELSLLDGSLGEDSEKITLEKARESIKHLSKLVNELIQSTQEITAALRPKILDELGLVPALEWLADKFEEKRGVVCRIYTKGSQALSSIHQSFASELYRLTEEMLESVGRNQSLAQIEIRVEAQLKFVTLEITAHHRGHGSDLEDQNEWFHSIRQRAEHLGGSFQSRTSSPGAWKLLVRVPFNEEASRRSSGFVC